MSYVDAPQRQLRSLLVRWICRCIEIAKGEDDGSAAQALTAYLDYTKEQTKELVKTIWRTTSGEQYVFPFNLCPLHVVARCVNVECCANVLLEHGWPVNERCFPLGDTAMHVACKFDNWRMVRLLLVNGADPNRTTRRHRTPMMAAIASEAHRCLDVLMDERANVTVKDVRNGKHYLVGNALTDLAEKGNVAAIRKMLARYGFEEMFDGSAEPLVSAIAFAQPGSLRALLDYIYEQDKSDLVNATNEAKPYGRTLLTLIGRKLYPPPPDKNERCIDCLNLLLQRGVGINATFYPAVYDAVRMGYGSDFCCLLLSYTDVEAMAVSVCDSIFNEAILRGMTTFTKALCEKKAGLLREKGFNFIVKAVSSKRLTVEMIDFLLDTGVNIVRKDDESGLSFSELFGCAYNFHFAPTVSLNVLGMLLRAGAAENLNILLNPVGGWIFQRDVTFLGEIVELLWQYSTQKHWNTVAPRLYRHRLIPRLPSLQRSCCSAVRTALMSTGRYPSMRWVNVKELGLPQALESCITFSSG